MIRRGSGAGARQLPSPPRSANPITQLKRLAQEHGYRLVPGDHEGRFDLYDAETGCLLAEEVTGQELRQLCAGTVVLGQLRQPSR